MGRADDGRVSVERGDKHGVTRGRNYSTFARCHHAATASTGISTTASDPDAEAVVAGMDGISSGPGRRRAQWVHRAYLPFALASDGSRLPTSELAA